MPLPHHHHRCCDGPVLFLSDHPVLNSDIRSFIQFAIQCDIIPAV